MDATEKADGCAGMGCLLLFLLFWSVITLAIDYVIARDMWRQWNTLTYFETVGTITHSKVICHSEGGEDSSYVPKIHYDYTVGWQQYSGKVYSFTPPPTEINTARRLVGDHPVGKAVPVYYCPDQPQRTVLRKGLETQDFLVPLMLVPFNGIMLIGIYTLQKIGNIHFSRSKQRWFRNFPVRYDALTFQLRLRVSYHNPIIMAIVGTLPAAFLALPFLFLGHLDAVLLVGWNMVVLGGLFGFWLAVHWNRSDLYVLAVDQMNGNLILPRQPDKTLGPVVPFDAIDDLTLSRQAAEHSEDRDNHLLTLHYRSGEESKSAVVASNHNRGIFLKFGDTKELTELKNWILCQIGRAPEGKTGEKERRSTG